MDIFDASTKLAKAKTVADAWFGQDIFEQTLQNDNDDEKFELERKLNLLESNGISILGKNETLFSFKFYSNFKTLLLHSVWIEIFTNNKFLDEILNLTCIRM